MDFDTPQSRNEAILQNILGADNVLVDPQSRVEEILTAILNGTDYTKEAQSRIESLLLCILNGTDTDLVAQSRNEAILIAKIKGEEYTADPQSRIEALLIEWSKEAKRYVGGGLVWNQYANGSINKTISYDRYYGNHYLLSPYNTVSDHVYFISVKGSCSNNAIWRLSRPILSDDYTSSHSFICKHDPERADGFSIQLKSADGNDATFFFNYNQVIDLNLLFGSSIIPEYIYNLEQNETGSGVAWFRKYFPDDYSFTSDVDLRFVNKDYYWLFGYENWKLGDETLRGVPTLVNDELVWDGDIYENGSITRKYQSILLTDRPWTYNTGSLYNTFSANLSNGKKSNYFKGMISKDKYTQVFQSGLADKQYFFSGSSIGSGFSRIVIRDDSCADVDAFMNAITGIRLVYERN